MLSISIIIPTYNRADKIARTLTSLCQQEFQNWEAVVIDDGSKDNTDEVVDHFLSDKRIRYISQENRGVSAARNLGVAKTQGKLITFLDSDDEAAPNWLCDFVSLDRSQSDVGYLSCGYKLFGQLNPPRSGREFSSEAYLSAPAGTFALSRRVFESVGGYDEKLRQSENWEMAARALSFCKSENLKIVHTMNCNITWHIEKTDAEHTARVLDRAAAYLHLHKKYAKGGVLYHRRKRFILGVAVNLLRGGKVEESRRFFYRSFWLYPSFKGLFRLACFEIPMLRDRVWQRRPTQSRRGHP